MKTQPTGRRDFLKQMTALGAAALPVVRASAAGATAASARKTAYDPAARFDVKVSEARARTTVLRSNGDARRTALLCASSLLRFSC